MKQSSMNNHTPRELPADFDVFNFDSKQYMEYSGLNAVIDQSFAELEKEIATAFKALEEHMNVLFSEWEAELASS